MDEVEEEAEEEEAEEEEAEGEGEEEGEDAVEEVGVYTYTDWPTIIPDALICIPFYIYLFNIGAKGGGLKGGQKVLIEAHRHEGVFIARSKEDALVTLNSTPGKDVYGEKRISVDGPAGADGNAVKLEYRVWNPFRSKLAAAILGGVDHIHIAPGSKVNMGLFVACTYADVTSLMILTRVSFITTHDTSV